MSQHRVACIQQPGLPDPNAAFEACIESIIEAANNEAELVLLPELHNGLYFCQTESTDCFDLAEPIPGPSTDILCKIAADYEIIIVGSLFEARAPGLYHNTAVIIDNDGEIKGKYRKMHIPDDPNYYEKFYFTPGDLGFTPIDTSIGKLGVLVCWDQWFPEAARLMALRGAEILLYPTAIGWVDVDDENEQKKQRDAWLTIQRSHAIANGIPVMTANRVGFEESPERTSGIDFWGSSFICGPQGEWLAKASTDESVILLSDIDKSETKRIRDIWPFLRDRRIDAYDGLNRRYLDE